MLYLGDIDSLILYRPGRIQLIHRHRELTNTRQGLQQDSGIHDPSTSKQYCIVVRSARRARAREVGVFWGDG